MKKCILLLVCLLTFTACTEKDNKTLKRTSVNEIVTKIQNKETFVMVLGSKDCYSCKMLKEEMSDTIKENNITLYGVNSQDLTSTQLDQLNIAAGNFETLPVLFYVVKGEVPLGNRYEYTLDPEGWSTWLSNMKLIKK